MIIHVFYSKGSSIHKKILNALRFDHPAAMIISAFNRQ